MVSDELWELVEPLIPSRVPARRGSDRSSAHFDRSVLAGIVFVLSTGR